MLPNGLVAAIMTVSLANSVTSRAIMAEYISAPVSDGHGIKRDRITALRYIVIPSRGKVPMIDGRSPNRPDDSNGELVAGDAV